MKKFLFTLAALLMASTAFAESYLYIDAADVVVTAEDIEQGNEITIPVRANFAARVSNWDTEFTYPEGMTVVFAEKGMDADVTVMNARGRATTVMMTLWGAAEPYTHMIGTLGEYGYWQNPDGENPTAWVPYGVAKWEGGEYEEMLLIYAVFDENYHGGEITTLTSVASGTDERGGTVREQGDHAQFFTHTSGELEDPNPIVAEKTQMPTITAENDDDAQVTHVTATGNGHIILMWDEQVEAEGEGTVTWDIPYGEMEEEYGISATAQEEGKALSDPAVATVYVPAKAAEPEVTANPTINLDWNYDEEYVMISAEGDGTVKLYIDGMLVTNPFMYRFQDEEHEILVEATAQEDGKEISETVNQTVVIPAKTPEPPTPVVAPEPTFTWDAETFTMTATCEDHEVVLMIGDEVVANPYTVEQTDEAQEITFVAYTVAGEDEDENSANVEYTVTVPAKEVEPPYETPAPEVTAELTDDALVITATGEGTVTLYVQYIDNETGEMTTETYTGEGTVTVPVARGNEDTYINYWAVAQADDEAVPGMTGVEYYVEVPAKENVEPDPHATGWWLVIFDKNGEEIWFPLSKGADESYTTTVTLDYGTYGEFFYDNNLSEDENDLNRPDVPFYFVVNGTVWGADEDLRETKMGEAHNTTQNPLFPGEEMVGYYTVPVGYSYTLGIFVGDQYYVYCAQGPHTSIDEINAGKDIAGVRYFNLAGQEMQEANGMTIVVTTYTDGTTSAVKVMK